MSKRPKKDLGVPSSAPFKEEILREAEQRRQQVTAMCSDDAVYYNDQHVYMQCCFQMAVYIYSSSQKWFKMKIILVPYVHMWAKIISV